MGGNRYRIFKDLPSAKNLRRNERRSAREKKEAEKNKRTRVYVRGKPGEVSEPRPLHGSREDTGEQIQ
ncbi:hypothetical protein ALC60_09651 [Trachymyrmex zeteki]|uniref:Uncharacterized protein n=1 Tax=Mycetomoellerius zeteki TaxID=64791 RepID=A0A151WTM1_9HYME|nr:hypothetical protein ALC60_09651 [Trachymyrmex zeteki]